MKQKMDNSKRGGNPITSDIKTIFPVLNKGAIIHRSPNVIRNYINLNPEKPEGDWYVINITAAIALSLSDGSRSIYDIIREGSGQEDADNLQIQLEVLEFFNQAEKKGYITFAHVKRPPQRIDITGSFDTYYPYHLCVELTYRCNLTCKHCYVNAGNDESAFPGALQ